MKPSLYFILCCTFLGLSSRAQDTRTQYPPGLRNAHFGVNIGYINYDFSSQQLEPGYTVESIRVPHAAVRIVLYGLPINRFLSAKITYMRPVKWVEYHSINNDGLVHTVWMNVAGLSLNGEWPLTRRLSLSGEAGMSIVTRNGFEDNGNPVVSNASYAGGIFGGSVQYRVGKKWQLQLTTAYSPANKKVRQPSTFFAGAGFNYYLRPLSPEKVKTNAAGGYPFPHQFLIGGFTSNVLGYGVNDFVSKGKIPIFWGGDAHVRRGFSMSYERNIFHARKVFAFDWSVGAGLWTTRDHSDQFLTLSLNPIFHFNAIRSKSFDLFFEYSVAGPTYISKTLLDSIETGRHFTFHDFMGMGVYAGKSRSIYAGLRIAHYSNGNIFPQNDGVMIPLTLNLGYRIGK